MSMPPPSMPPRPPVADIHNRDYYVIIDKSGSMSEEDVGGESRWKAVAESTEAIVREVVKHDPDGITVFVFSSRSRRYNDVTSVDVVRNIFRENSPMGGTKLAPVLRDALGDYFLKREAGKAMLNGATILVITDGRPDDPEPVRQEIIRASHACMHEHEVGIGFFQIGNDQGATAYLRGLDNDLKAHGAKFDIVNTKTFDQIEEEGLGQALMDAIVD